MTLLAGDDFFASRAMTVTVEPRAPQPPFPEHHHDFYEIVLVESGAGVHVFNDRPYTLCSGTVCFVRDRDRHLFENVEGLYLTNVLYRSPQSFRFLTGIDRFLPPEDGQGQVHWHIGQEALQEARQHIRTLAQLSEDYSDEGVAASESRFLQLLLLLHRSCCQLESNSGRDANVLALLRWLDKNFTEEVGWSELADRYSLALRTLHRQVKQHTGMTPQRYLNRLRLLEARRRLFQTDQSITQIAHECGFGDSNHFSTQFRREFDLSPKMMRNSVR